MKIVSIRRLLSLILLLLLLGILVVANDLQTGVNEKIATYLTRYLAEFNNREHSLHNKFYGEFIPIDNSLQSKLTETFSNHKFVMAKTRFTHWFPDDRAANILLIIDKNNGEVIGHQWAMWFSTASESFHQFLLGYPSKSKDDALNKIKVLSTLIVSSTANGNVGQITSSKGKIQAELKWGNDVWRLFRVPIDDKLNFGRLELINPKINEAEAPK